MLNNRYHWTPLLRLGNTIYHIITGTDNLPTVILHPTKANSNILTEVDSLMFQYIQTLSPGRSHSHSFYKTVSKCPSFNQLLIQKLWSAVLKIRMMFLLLFSSLTKNHKKKYIYITCVLSLFNHRNIKHDIVIGIDKTFSSIKCSRLLFSNPPDFRVFSKNYFHAWQFSVDPTSFYTLLQPVDVDCRRNCVAHTSMFQVVVVMF